VLYPQKFSIFYEGGESCNNTVIRYPPNYFCFLISLVKLKETMMIIKVIKMA